jgi:hypothetical protein
MTMRFMVMIKSTPEIESAASPPSEKMLTEMTRFNEELVNAGIMLGGEGLHPSSKGAKVVWKGQKTSVKDGPFAEAKELVAGFWIWKCASLEEAVSWARRIPNPDGQDGEVEIRPVFESEEFGAELTPEVRAKEAELRARIEKQQHPS